MKFKLERKKINGYIHWALMLFGPIWVIPALMLINRFDTTHSPSLIFFVPAYITIILSLFFKSDEIGFWDKFKRCKSKYNRGGLSGTVRCDKRIGHPGNHRYIGLGLGGTRIEWSTDCEIKEVDEIKT